MWLPVICDVHCTRSGDWLSGNHGLGDHQAAKYRSVEFWEGNQLPSSNSSSVEFHNWEPDHLLYAFFHTKLKNSTVELGLFDLKCHDNCWHTIHPSHPDSNIVDIYSIQFTIFGIKTMINIKNSFTINELNSHFILLNGNDNFLNGHAAYYRDKKWKYLHILPSISNTISIIHWVNEIYAHGTKLLGLGVRQLKMHYNVKPIEATIMIISD